MAVSVKLANEIFYIELWHILSLMLIISINYVIMLKARKTPLLFSYLTAQLMLVIWIVSKIFKTVSPFIELRWFFIVTQYFGVSFLGFTLIVFAYIYSKNKLPSKKQLALWILPALISFSIVATNPLHYLFYSKFTFYSDSFGPLFYLTMIISYSYLLIAIRMLARGFLRMFGRAKKRAYLFAFGIIFPLVINVFYVMDVFEALFDYHPLFDYTPIATNISLIMFALAAFQFRFLDILPIAEKQIYNGISDAVVVIDKKKNLISHNKFFNELFPGIKENTLLSDTLLRSENDRITLNDRVYRIEYKQKKNLSIIRLIDITVIDATLDLLQVKNNELSDANNQLEKLLLKKRKLAEKKTRNYILQELHDVLGHATVLAISTCEVEILSGCNNYKNTLINISRLLSNSSQELYKILNIENSSEERTSLLIAIEGMVKNINQCSLKIDIVLQGTTFELKRQSSEACYRLCQEAITNSIKYAKATELSLIFRFNENDLEIFTIDNGIGCGKVVYGKGLNGMRARINAIGGMMEILTDVDCGFQIHVRIPKE